MATTTLRGLTRWYAGVQDVNQFTDAQIDGLLNRWLHTMQLWIEDAYEGFEFAGTIAKSNLVAGTNNYAFPTDFVQIQRIEISYSGNENTWSRANLIDMRRVHYDLANQEDTGDRVTAVVSPIVYVFNNRLYLKDPPANAVTNGLWVYYTPLQTELSGTTDEPTFPEHFHKGLSLGAAIDWMISKKPDGIGALDRELQKVKLDLQTYLHERIETEPPRFKPRREAYE